jgi:hypothetical protein
MALHDPCFVPSDQSSWLSSQFCTCSNDNSETNRDLPMNLANDSQCFRYPAIRFFGFRVVLYELQEIVDNLDDRTGGLYADSMRR